MLRGRGGGRERERGTERRMGFVKIGFQRKWGRVIKRKFKGK